MPRTVEYGGRSWCHQQFYGLVKAVIDSGRMISFGVPEPKCGTYDCLIEGPWFHAHTPWLALCAAVEAMEDEKP